MKNPGSPPVSLAVVMGALLLGTSAAHAQVALEASGVRPASAVSEGGGTSQPEVAPGTVAVSLAEVMRLLGTRSPVLAASKAGVEVARAEETDARVIPNPTLSWNMLKPLAGADTTAGTQNTFSLEQPLFLAGQRGRRIRAAQALVAAEEANAVLSEQELRREATQRYVTLQAAQEKLELWRMAQTRLAEVERIIAGRRDAGASSDYDALRVKAETAVVASEVTRAEADVRDAEGTLSTLLGMPRWRPSASERLHAFGVTATEEGDAALQGLPALRAKSAELTAARASVDAARRSAWPELSVQVGAFTTSAPQGVAGIVGLAVPLPVFDRAQGAIARANAQANRVALERQALLGEVDAERYRATRVLAARRAALDGFEQSAGARLVTLETMAQEAYRSGAGNILDLLDALRTNVELETQRADLLEDLVHAEVEAAYALGRPQLVGGVP